MKKENKLIKTLLNLDLVLAGLSLIILIIFTFSGVIMRYIFGRPFTWLEEVQLLCMVWVVYAGAGAGFRMGNHVAIEILVDMFPAKLQKLFDVLISIVVVVVVGYLFVQSIGFVRLFVQNGRTTNMLRIPYTLIYGIAPISCILMIFNYFYSIYKDNQDLDLEGGNSNE